ncbi:MAG: DUF5916 domain-containing protein [Gemmatimonadota bacterium]
MILLAAALLQGGVVATPAVREQDSVIYKKAEEIRVPLVRADRRPVLDGRLDDDVWRVARPMDRFVQYEPVDSVLPPQQSVGWVAYDDQFLYVAFRAFEPDRGNIRATVHPRERGGELDDKVAVSVDTYNDNRRTNVFRVSPIGLQFDGVKTEGQRTDDTPDAVWYSAARIDSLGWVAELAIPFASLRLPAGDSLDFGFDFVRYHGKAGVRSSWSPRRRGSPCDICQQGTIAGLRDVHPGRTLDLLPYFSGSEAGTRVFGADSALSGGTWYPTRTPASFGLGDPTASVGLDLRFVPSPSSTINATVNPDFSQIESDDEQIRVNQRFALFFQERRPFFLDSRDVFDVTRQGEGGGGEGGGGAGQLLYTRAIVNPSLGARLTGKQGAFQYGLLYARDDEPAWFHYNRHESGGVVARTGAPADVLVLRARRDVLSDSWFGASFLGRRSGDSRSGVAATDMALRWGTVTLAGEAGLSVEREPADTNVAALFDGEERTGAYYRTALDRRGRELAWSLTASGLSPGFRNQLGRYSRIGVRAMTGRINHFNYPNGRLVQQTSQSISIARTDQFGGGLLDMSLTPRIDVTFRQRAGFSVSVPFEHQTMLGKALRQVGMLTDFRIDAAQRVQIGGFFYAGDRELFDPADPRVTKGVFASLRMTLRPVPQAAIELRGQRSNHFAGWGGDLVDDAKIVRLRGTWQFTRRLGARLIGEYSNQYNSLVENPFDRRAVRLASSLLATWEVAPSSFMYFGYNDVMQDFEQPVVERAATLRTGNQVFLKLSYLFRI